MSVLARGVDGVLEATVVGGFSRIGAAMRSRLDPWDDPPRLDGRTVIVTGATSGIGHATAVALARLGATVHFLARDPGRAETARRSIRAASGSDAVTYDIADLGDQASLRRFVDRFATRHHRLDVLIHNGGALTRAFRTSADGVELTFATHVLGPFLLTTLLLPMLRQAAPGRVVTVASGGMYSERLDLAGLEMTAGDYDGVTAYARAKRAQVALNREWAQLVPSSQVVFHAMHPGWADTPGVRTSLPRFHRVMGPLLRSPEQAADTVVWLAASAEAARSTGRFWHDRRPRGEHRLPWTRAGDSGAALWRHCATRTAPCWTDAATGWGGAGGDAASA